MEWSKGWVQVAVAMAVVAMAMGQARGAITVEETVSSECSAAIAVHCSNQGTDFGAVAVAPATSVTMAVTTSLADPDLVCTFASAGVAALNVTPPRQLKLWEYLKMGFSDSPEMACAAAGCRWVARDDGLYYRPGGSPDAAASLFASWADVPNPA